MRTTYLLALMTSVGLLVSAAACSKDDDDDKKAGGTGGGASGDSLCDQMCPLVEQLIKDGKSGCSEDCPTDCAAIEAILPPNSCQAEVNAVATCYKSADDLVCDDTFMLASESCATQLTAVIACASAAATGGAGGMTGTGGATSSGGTTAAAGASSGGTAGSGT